MFLISVAFYFFVLNSPTNENGASALGIVCNIFTVLFFASPLSTMVSLQTIAKLSLGIFLSHLIVKSIDIHVDLKIRM